VLFGVLAGLRMRRQIKAGGAETDPNPGPVG